MVEFLPRWMAPNMVTLVGFMFVIGNVILLEIFVPDLIGPVSFGLSWFNIRFAEDSQAPGWVYISFAFGVWA
jgi:ethanolaminephosphotransferase